MQRFNPAHLLICTILFVGNSAQAGGERPLSQSPFNPDAQRVDLFHGMQQGFVEVQVVPNGAKGGNILLKNTLNEPITVQMPDGFVAVPVSAQFGAPGQGFGNGQAGMNNNGFASSGTGTQAVSGSTSTGTGMNGANAPGIGNAGANGMNGFFSIPARRTLRVHYTSVCLNYGLQEPTPRTQVTLMPIEEYTSDPVLQGLLAKVGTGEVDQKTLQAAVWNVSSNLSWEQLAAKTNGPVAVPGDQMFSQNQISAARRLVSKVSKEANKTDEPLESANTQGRLAARRVR